MKLSKTLFVALSLAAVMGLSSCTYEESQASVNSRTTTEAQVDNQARAMEAVPVPSVSNYLERKTVRAWVERWDKPSVACYVYLFSYGTCVGYYVSNGKPVSTQSYLIPEDYREYGYSIIRQAPDLDGTYGANNPGIRFFTASGVAVEWAGSGASYLYSDAKLPLAVKCLGE